MKAEHQIYATPHQTPGAKSRSGHPPPPLPPQNGLVHGGDGFHEVPIDVEDEVDNGKVVVRRRDKVQRSRNPSLFCCLALKTIDRLD